ncbi:MAG: ammonium transporter [Nitrospirota bacterium]|nr:ammonium transporter [Nitrospirota bacterium]
MFEAGSQHQAWLLIATTLALLTVPGVALFYAGMVRRKNVLNTFALPILALVLVSLCWIGGIVAVDRWLGIGNMAAVGSEAAPLRHVGLALSGALALALVAGGVVERTRCAYFLVFGLFWVLLVYGPLAHSLWGSGWLASIGSLDFAGGAVVHISAGVTALVASILIGPRRGYGRTEMRPNNLPLSVCGAGLMWVGWCGFASGQGATTMGTVTGAFVAIQASAASAALAWTAVEWVQREKPTVLGTVSGGVAGLVAITPAAGYVGPLSAIVIGIGAGGLCYMVVNFVKPILGYDDSLDVFGMHAVGGTWGMIATGLFASTAVNPSGSDGLFYGYPYQFFAQAVAVIAVWVFAGGMTYLLVKGLGIVLSPRVGEGEEVMGLDLTQHGEKGYS